MNTQNTHLSLRTLLRTIFFAAVVLKSQAAFAEADAVDTRFGVHRLLLFKFKEEATLTDIEGIKQIFCEIRGKVDGMNEAVWAEDFAMDASKNFTHAVILSFDSETAVKDYETHPDHLRLVEIAPPFIANFFEMNYETNAANVSRADTR